MIATMYGRFESVEPVVLDLLQSRALERTKGVQQYGIAYFVGQPSFTRYDHCLGVWALLRRFTVSQEEQIAGLLHDVSHTIFSHVGDYLFNHNDPLCSYQDSIHEWYLSKTDISEVLKKHGIRLEDVLHKSGQHAALEQDLPDVCADRLEYNLRGGLLAGLITEKEINTLLNDLGFKDGFWFFDSLDSARRLGLVSLHLTEHVWGCPRNHILYSVFAQVLQRALEIKLISLDDVHFSTDAIIWQRLCESSDSQIQLLMKHVTNIKNFYHVVHDVQHADHIVKTKFRGLNPWIRIDGMLQRLVDSDPIYAQKFYRVKQQMSDGWPVCIEQGAGGRGRNVSALLV